MAPASAGSSSSTAAPRAGGGGSVEARVVEALLARIGNPAVANVLIKRAPRLGVLAGDLALMGVGDPATGRIAFTRCDPETARAPVWLVVALDPLLAAGRNVRTPVPSEVRSSPRGEVVQSTTATLLLQLFRDGKPATGG